MILSNSTSYFSKKIPREIQRKKKARFFYHLRNKNKNRNKNQNQNKKIINQSMNLTELTTMDTPQLTSFYDYILNTFQSIIIAILLFKVYTDIYGYNVINR